jgi:hypothetical protein
MNAVLDTCALIDLLLAGYRPPLPAPWGASAISWCEIAWKHRHGQLALGAHRDRFFADLRAVGVVDVPVTARLAVAATPAALATPAAARTALIVLLEAYADVLLGEAEAERWARFIVREQMQPSPAFEVIFGMMSRGHAIAARLVAVALGRDVEDDAVRLADLLGAFPDMLDDGLAAEIEQDLTGQARGGDAGGDAEGDGGHLKLN